VRFVAEVADDQPAQGLSVRVGARAWPMTPVDPAEPDRAWTVTVPRTALGQGARWQVRVRDGYGALTTQDRAWGRCH
jgi:hypothetical protein